LPEDGAKLCDLTAYTRDLIQQVEVDLAPIGFGRQVRKAIDQSREHRIE
tara:strand:- start:1099 stop:1245 length:147 start_codon:yes stop_codon:yes gene_type:complete